MAKQDASASRALPTLATLVPDIWRFVRMPRMRDSRQPWSRITLLLLLAIIALDFSIDVVFQQLLTLVDANLFDLPDMHESETSVPQLTLSFLVLAPLVEEAQFRGWMSGRKASLRFAAWGLAAFLVVLSGELLITQDYLTPIIITAFALAGIGFVQWLLTFRRDSEVPESFRASFHWFVWGSSVLFGLFHLGNYEGHVTPAHLLVVSPAIIGGMLLAYTRVRFGLRAAMLHHALYNGAFLLATHLGIA